MLAVAALVASGVLLLTRGGPTGSANSRADAALATVDRPDLVDAFIAAATSDVAAVTTYDYRSLDSAQSNGEAVTTGAYQAAFRTALSGSLAADARRLHRVQTFTLRAAGIGSVTADGGTATVVVFGLQSVTDDTTGGKARSTPVTLVATMRKEAERYLIAGLVAGDNAGLPSGTAGLRAAAEAGREEVVAVLTLRHDHVDEDLATAIAGAVDPLRSSLATQEATTRAQVARGGYDLAGAVTAVAVERATGTTLSMLVAATGTRTVAGRTSVVVDGRYRVTVVRAGNAWRTSAIDSVTG